MPSTKLLFFLPVGVHHPGTYRIILDTDSKEFGGFGRLNHSTDFHTLGDGYAGRENSLMVYIPSRSAFILARHTPWNTVSYEMKISIT